jgi:hypothetical protein
MGNIPRNSLFRAPENLIVLEAELASEKTSVITYQPEGVNTLLPFLLV